MQSDIFCVSRWIHHLYGNYCWASSKRYLANCVYDHTFVSLHDDLYLVTAYEIERNPASWNALSIYKAASSLLVVLSDACHFISADLSRYSLICYHHTESVGDWISCRSAFLFDEAPIATSVHKL